MQFKCLITLVDLGQYGSNNDSRLLGNSQMDEIVPMNLLVYLTQPVTNHVRLKSLSNDSGKLLKEIWTQ